jgi:uncharacterized membrane protein
VSILLGLLTAATTAVGALLFALAAAASLAKLAQGHFRDSALDAMRRTLAAGIVATLGLLAAATLLRTLQLESWSALGLFVLVFTLRLLIKRSLSPALRSAEAR